MRDPLIDERHEWLEADGLGGFASGTTSLVRTRRYHALLLAAVGSPSNRFVLVNGCDVRLATPGGVQPLTSHRFAPNDLHPEGLRRLVSFDAHPWPTWRWQLPDGTEVVHELFVPKGQPLVALRWQLVEPRPGTKLVVRPLLSGRDPHALHHENPGFAFEAHTNRQRVEWRPYPGVPAIVAASNGTYHHAPDWWRRFHYEQDRERGFEHVEDLASPGTFEFDLGSEAVLLFAADFDGSHPLPKGVASSDSLFLALGENEWERRHALARSLVQSGDAYLVRRGVGLTVVAGYPWFTDWGRDTFIALRGICLAAGRVAEARDILLQWSELVSEGMLPNRFPEHSHRPDYNSVDASLWFVIAVHELLLRAPLRGGEQERLLAAVLAILRGYQDGTRYGIRMTPDALLAAGVPGVQLTWMDAKIGDHVVTPRIGKPVEVQALWINALRIGAHHLADGSPWAALADRAQQSFVGRFWNPEREMLHDVVDVDHREGTVDPTLRPNQIFAAGGLPFGVLDEARARLVVGVVERELLTPMGLRTLARDDPRYCGRYEGGPESRDHGYHQGTVWPWLLGPFVEAWVRARGGSASAKQQARQRFLGPLLERAGDPGFGHLPEIADGDPPHASRGSPFQAWSVGEALRLDLDVLA